MSYFSKKGFYDALRHLGITKVAVDFPQVRTIYDHDYPGPYETTAMREETRSTVLPSQVRGNYLSDKLGYFNGGVDSGAAIPAAQSFHEGVRGIYREPSDPAVLPHQTIPEVDGPSDDGLPGRFTVNGDVTGTSITAKV